MKRLIFWDFPRGSVFYDLVVALILAFIFLTPAEWFRDQPKTPKNPPSGIILNNDGVPAVEQNARGIPAPARR
jgi:hypothetical protein